MKHLKKKNEFKFKGPSWKILDTFSTPRNTFEVVLTSTEVTSLCPLTSQPDYHTVEIRYYPEKVCVESKSLKLYLGSFRMEGCFTETLSSRIAEDLFKVLNCSITVKVTSVSRGGISITGYSGKWEEN